jgi:hypothetical protein
VLECPGADSHPQHAGVQIHTESFQRENPHQTSGLHDSSHMIPCAYLVKYTLLSVAHTTHHRPMQIVLQSLGGN